MTFIQIFNVPDLGCFPPSTPVRTNLIVACFSRSKALFSTNSADTLWSSLCVSRLKCSFGLSLYSFSELLPTSESSATGRGNLSPGLAISVIFTVNSLTGKCGALSFISKILISTL
uniref:Uncharacterized protein n=1 Tax=Sinocyclocheilus anshuiensis TaxID=1608454 RepID=A0A671QDZ4_9TELE